MENISDADFKKEVLESKQLVVLDFWAEWCGPCKMMGPIFEQTSIEFKDVKFGKVNIDTEHQTAANYGIMSIPTIMIFKNGEKVNQIVGLVKKEKLVELIKKHL
jgi:thioredoxin 1